MAKKFSEAQKYWIRFLQGELSAVVREIEGGAVRVITEEGTAYVMNRNTFRSLVNRGVLELSNDVSYYNVYILADKYRRTEEGMRSAWVEQVKAVADYPKVRSFHGVEYQITKGIISGDFSVYISKYEDWFSNNVASEEEAEELAKEKIADMENIQEELEGVSPMIENQNDAQAWANNFAENYQGEEAEFVIAFLPLPRSVFGGVWVKVQNVRFSEAYRDKVADLTSVNGEEVFYIYYGLEGGAPSDTVTYPVHSLRWLFHITMGEERSARFLGEKANEKRLDESAEIEALVR